MIRTAAVVVPVANEQALVGRCLEAIAAARAHALGALQPLEVRVVVVLDSCTDDSAEVVGQHPDVDAVSCLAGCVGVARALGVRSALAGVVGPLDRVWIANTDADSRVPVDWITAMVTAARGGAHLVLGTVAPAGDPEAAWRRRWAVQHRLVEGHNHVHGANLGIRADAYVALGGWPLLASGEDIALARRAETTPGLEIVRTAATPVVTSDRRHGRTPHGFAAYLRALDAHAPPQARETAPR